MKQVEQRIVQLTDVEELNRIGGKYASSGNHIVAMKAFLRAAELGDTKCCSKIASIFLSRCWSYDNEDYRKAADLIKQWREEGDEEVEYTLDLQKRLWSVLIQ